MKKSEQLMWLFLIKNGGCIRESKSWRDEAWNYYSGSYTFSESIKAKALSDIKEHGVDWDSTNPVQDDTEYEFDGTDSPSEIIPVLRGTLVINNGNGYKFRMIRDDMSILDIVAELCTMPDIDTILKEL